MVLINIESVEQWNGATYGRHIWGDTNIVDVYQNGSHTHYIDIHVDGVEHDMHQEGSGSHYAHIYWYGNTDDSESTMTQKGDASHNACLLYTSPSPRDKRQSRMPSSA